ncbi:hypothetical protein SPRG_01046 [Saprolegnia parasitica CBS 223.65]|uniref:FAM192A/Fyv6 N-terminal domain-containing protein n=1 Tax=Saprolegnia parasitica (strain CBS 223.65) TaxID=695850 RepID=A0A067CW96_SAPPC|nr:hypothetical protein SPRG_01046 [Saprolegnia parasitica CBS 223.65]KDO34984.1 hypothetical protein SPRG_01046 [Saprolegnia parasitica CBS 223.65]|eukprot:XP_012194638.1 hypothetical protein SPRG_01046 [Saprolegnia parasitica CBS 223.65]
MAAPTSSVTSKFPTEAAGLGLAEPADPLARPRSKPIAGFVSTAVLSSSDGLFGDNVEETRISDKPEAADIAISDARPLYDRLKEMKDQRDAEWKEKNNPFAPPKGLDDEEFEFIRALEDQQKSVEDGLKRQLDTDLAQFVMAKKDTLAHTKKVAAVVLPTTIAAEKKLPPVVVVKAKPKKIATTKGSAPTQPKKRQKNTKTTSTGLGLVANYSDGDSSSSDSD